MVDIALGTADNPQVIFETLNAKGVDLQPADLVRNSVFQRSAAEPGVDVNGLYENYWKRFDSDESVWRRVVQTGRRKRTVFELFLQHFLVMKAESDIPVADLYAPFKKWLKEQSGVATEALLAELCFYADTFATFYPDEQTSLAIRDERALRLYRLRELDIGTMYPFLLRLVTEAKRDAGLDTEIPGMLTDLESYVVRRAVCGLSSKNFNQLFPRLYKKLAEANALSRAGLRAHLIAQTGTLTWPGDDEFRKRWIESRQYQGGSTIARVRVVLEALETHLLTNKQEGLALSERLTVEHLAPQKWKAHWSAVVDDASEWRIDSFGNLTLLKGALNTSVSNGPFPAKRQEILKHSLLALNLFLKDRVTWDVDGIEARGVELFEHARLIWPRANVEAQSLPGH